MRHTKISIVGILTISLASLVTFAQTGPKATQRAIWQTRAETVTALLLKETGKADDLKKAVLYANLGDLWWKSDKDKSNAWFEKGVDTIFFYSTDDVKLNNKEYLSSIRQILDIISNRNKKQTDRLISIVTSAQKGDSLNRDFDADTLIDFALAIVKTTPGKAAELGILSFRFGQPEKFYQLYWELKKVNTLLAEKLFKAAISSAYISPNPQIASGLKNAVFPELISQNAPNSLISSSHIKTETLNFLADFTAQQYAKFVNKSIESCSIEASLVAPLRNQFASLLPQREPVIIQAIAICLANLSDASRDLSTNATDSSLTNSVERLLKLADDAKDDKNIRVYYLLRAVNLANEQKKYKLATEILDNMSEDERKIDLDFWVELRYTVAAGWAFQQFTDLDITGAAKTLEKVPTDTQPLAKVGFALKFKPGDSTAREFVLERIKEAENEFVKSTRPFQEKLNFWLRVVQIYSSYNRTTDAAETFDNFVKAFNKESFENKTSKPQVKSSQILAVISPELFEAQDHSLIESAASIEDPNSRIQAQLAFLKIALREVQKRQGNRNDEV